MPVSVGDIMSRPVVVVTGDATLERVARLMRDQSAPCVAVVSDDGRFRGVIGEEQFIAVERHLPFSFSYAMPELFGEWVAAQEVEEGYRAARAKRAADVMVAGHVTKEDTRLSDVLQPLKQGHVLVVVRDGRPVGTLCRHDLIKLVARDAPASDSGEEAER